MPYKDREKYRAYQREYKRRWIRENKQRHIEYVRNREGKMQEWFLEYRKNQACEICGENHPACLDFHHVNPAEKKFEVSARRNRPSMKALIEEIAKCRVLCANCHRKEHWKQREQARINEKAVHD